MPKLSVAVLVGVCIAGHVRGLPLRSSRARLGPGSDEGNGTARSVIAGCEGFSCLQRYVELPDASYRWRDTGLRLTSTDADTNVTCTLHVLNMTSQTWLGGVASQPQWNHTLVLVEPSNLVGGSPKSSWTVLVIGDALGMPVENLTRSPEPDMDAAVGLAARTGMRAAVVYGVPPELVTFADDPDHGGALREEAEKVYGWQHVLSHPDNPEFIIELPVAKAVIRAMDAVAEYTADSAAGPTRQFALTGFSKRGMAAWMAGAVDGRVGAILPGAMPLRMREMTKTTIRCFGHASIAAEDYFRRGVFGHFDEPGAAFLFKAIDPYYYMDNLTMPKFIMMTGNDEFMLPDATRSWWNDLPGANTFLMKPNLAHLIQMARTDFLPGAAAFLQGVVGGQAAPRITWEVNDTDGAITARVAGHHVPRAVRLWSSQTCRGNGGRRDFRMYSNDSRQDCLRCGTEEAQRCRITANAWTQEPLATNAPDGKSWVASKPAPNDGTWVAFYLEFEFDGPESGFHDPWQASTEVSVLPQTYPFKECFNDGCMGDHKTLA